MIHTAVEVKGSLGDTYNRLTDYSYGNIILLYRVAPNRCGLGGRQALTSASLSVGVLQRCDATWYQTFAQVVAQHCHYLCRMTFLVITDIASTWMVVQSAARDGRNLGSAAHETARAERELM